MKIFSRWNIPKWRSEAKIGQNQCSGPFLFFFFFLVGIGEVQERVSERIEKIPGRYVDGTLNISRLA